MLQTANEVMVASNKIRPTTASLPTSSAPGLLPAQPAAVVTVVGVVVGTPESLEASGTAGALEAAEILGIPGVVGALEAVGVPEATGAAGVNLCSLLLAFSGFSDQEAAVVVAVAVVAVMVVVVAGALEAVGVPEATGAAGVNLCPLLLAFSGFPDLEAAVVVAVAVVAVMVVVVVMVLVAVVVVVVVVVVVLVAVVVVVVVMVLVAVVVVVAMVLVFAMCSRI